MRFSLATLLVSACLVAARPSLEARDTGHHTIEVPAEQTSVGSPFDFAFADTTRNPGDTSYLEVYFYNLTHRLFVSDVHFLTPDYTQANASLTVPDEIQDGYYGIVVNEIDNGNAIYGGVHYGIHFTR